MRNYTGSVFDRSNCSSGDQLASCLPQNWYMTILSAAQVVASIFAILFMLVLQYAWAGQVALHRNAKLLLANHFITALLHCVCEIASHALDLKRKIHRAPDPDDDDWTSPSNSTSQCLYGEIPQTATFAAIMVTLCMLALERIRATIDYRTYEKAGGFHGYLLVTIQWTIVVAATLVLVFNTYTNDDGGRKLTCLLTTHNSTQVASFLMLAMGVAEIAALSTFYVLLRLNERKRFTANCDPLTEKYQIDENIRSTKLMIPIVWTHFLFLFPPMCFYAIYPKIDDIPDPHTYAIITTASDWTPWYCVVLPIVIFWRQKALRVNLRKKLQEMGLNKVSPLESQRERCAQELAARHFDMLNTMWNSKRAISLL